MTEYDEAATAMNLHWPCEKCRTAYGKEAMCDIGRALYAKLLEAWRKVHADSGWRRP